jgi:hypothetical protein
MQEKSHQQCKAADSRRCDMLRHEQRKCCDFMVLAMVERTRNPRVKQNEKAFVPSRRDPHEKIMGWLLPRAHL